MMKSTMYPNQQKLSQMTALSKTYLYLCFFGQPIFLVGNLFSGGNQQIFLISYPEKTSPISEDSHRKLSLFVQTVKSGLHTSGPEITRTCPLCDNTGYSVTILCPYWYQVYQTAVYDTWLSLTNFYTFPNTFSLNFRMVKSIKMLIEKLKKIKPICVSTN